MEWTNTYKCLNDFINELTREYESRFPGHTIECEITGDDDNLAVHVTGPEEYYYIVHGRGPGKQPPVGSLDKWIEKNIGEKELPRVRSLAFLIGRKIANEGTKGHPEFLKYYDELVNKYNELIIKAENKDAHEEFDRISKETNEALSMMF